MIRRRLDRDERKKPKEKTRSSRIGRIVMTADELAGRGCVLPDPSSSALSHSEIYSLHRIEMNRILRKPSAHQWYSPREFRPISTVQEIQGSSDGLGAL
ncbi:hypothetical protein TNCV_2938051 [Trichonephila clavipes]|nr:hypothetical protein TNCV_2938051 [Trichonephila clavipes]